MSGDQSEEDSFSIPKPIATHGSSSYSNPPVSEPSEITLPNEATETDSGRTVTIPNDNVVTVTSHTLIITSMLPDTTFTTAVQTPTTVLPISSSGESSLPLPGETGVGDGEQDDAGEAGQGFFTTGVLVGISVGGAALVALLIFLALWVKRRQKKSREEHANSVDDDPGRDHLVEEKFFPSQHVTPHTTGTRGEDPFAPFGGRADQPESEYPIKPPENTFEMDGTSAAPVELPDTPISIISPVELPISPATRPPPMPKMPPAADPSANLNSLQTKDGRPQYINHWNSYRTMGEP